MYRGRIPSKEIPSKKVVQSDMKKYYEEVYPSKRGMRMHLRRAFPSLPNEEVDEYVQEFYGTWIGDVYNEIPKIDKYSRFRETTVDRVHQMDLMTMPSSDNNVTDGTEKQPGQSYILSYIDVASRRAAAVKLNDKLPRSVVSALKEIYYDNELADKDLNIFGRPRQALLRAKLAPPQILQTDGGGEFCNKTVDNYLKKMGIRHDVAPTSNHQAIVERFNQTLAKPLFRYMDEMEEKLAREKNEPGYRYTEWESKLQDVVAAYNERHHSYFKTEFKTDASPNDVYFGGVKIWNKEPIDAVYTDVNILPIGTSVRIPRLFTNMKRRATDTIWSNEVYMVSGSIKKSIYDPMKYKLMNDALETLSESYYREELLPVKDETTLAGYSLGPNVIEEDVEDTHTKGKAKKR